MTAFGGMGEILYTASVWVLPVLFAITLHEAAHGYVAWLLGDDTALMRGRVSFNPLRHVDTFGTILLPGMLLLLKSPFLFGYAKPVPVNFARLRSPRRDMMWVALAGPGINIALAFVSALAIHLAAFLPETAAYWVVNNLVNSLIINLVLAVFNMLPLPPLDGGRVAVALLPRWLALPLARLERFGMLILIGLLFFLPLIGSRLGVQLSIFHTVVGVPVEFLYNAILFLTGQG